MQYERNDMDFSRGKFRVRGDTLEIQPAYEELALEIRVLRRHIERIASLDPLTGEILARDGLRGHLPGQALRHLARQAAERHRGHQGRSWPSGWPSSKSRASCWRRRRLEARTNYDLEMLQEAGFCSGVENYSRHLAGSPPGSAPWTLLDYFPEDFSPFIDESHMSIPQIRGMYHGDFARKQTLVDFGFRLPSALDNRPLNFDEFNQRMNQVVFVSATPGRLRAEGKPQVVEQLVQPDRSAGADHGGQADQRTD